MSRKYSQSGLPEQLGSNAFADRYNDPQAGFKPKPMCGIPNCKTRRTGWEKLPNGEKLPVYAQGFGEVVIRTSDGKVHGHVCQVHYQRIIDDAKLDQLSVAARAEDRQAQTDIPLRTDAPRGLVDNLTKIQDALQHAQQHESEERWQREREGYERASERDEELAARWASEHDDDV